MSLNRLRRSNLMKTIKTISVSSVIVPPQHVDSHKLLKFPIFACFIILIMTFLLTACPDDKEITYDNLPAELQNKIFTGTTSDGDFKYTFYTNSFTYSVNNTNFTVSDLTINKATNKWDDKNDFPSGYEIIGTIKNSNMSGFPAGRSITYYIFFNSSKSRASIYRLN